jgi:lipid II:glycine glycyltransferase (peptidoglycan interpeptide bridge formation enzyme)
VIVQRRAASAYRAAATHTPPLALVEPAPAEWDAFVEQHPQGHLLQSVAWGSLKSAFGWELQRIAVVGGASDDTSTVESVLPRRGLLAGAQVLFRRRYGLSMAYVPRGPLFSGDSAIDDLLLAALERQARRRRAVMLRLEPELLERHSTADYYHSWLLLREFQPAEPIQPRSTVQLDLQPEPEQLFARLSKGHRADVRRAGRQGVDVRVGTVSDIPAFYAIMQSTGQRAEFAIHSEAYYRFAWHLFQPRSLLLLAEQAGAPVAAHMMFADARAGHYLYSGATETGLKAGANHLLQWHAVQWARTLGCTHYDLWGIPDALGRAASTADDQQREALEEAARSDPLIGVYRFKKGFGGEIVRYLPAYDQVYLPPLYRLWQRRMQG